MTDVIAGPEPSEGTGDALLVPVFSDLTWGPGAGWAADGIGDWVGSYLEAQEFSGKTEQVAVLPASGALPYGRVVFVGVGDDIDAEGLRRAAGSGGSAALRYRDVTTTLHQVEIDGAEELVATGFLLGQYRFVKYRSDPKPALTERLIMAGAGDVEDVVARARALVDAVNLARDLVNEPAVAKPPVVLAEIARGIADEHGLGIVVYDESEIQSEGFGGLYGVSRGADNPPRMVVLRYAPEGARRTVAFVGKGIVFDSGGLSLKTAKAMETMKTDMSGAAAVYGAMQAIAALGLPVNVIGITPLTENLTGGSAQRPGDVLRARNGKTIEVINTDAEGRLVLADGLSLATEAEPDLIVDVATLTGAAAVALGPKVGGVFARDDEAASVVMEAARRSGERMWRLPIESDYRSYLDSDVADMKNSSGQRYGGAIIAALFLAEFVGDVPWAHLDIAGPARSSNAEHYIPKGGTGFGVRTLVEIAAAYAE